MSPGLDGADLARLYEEAARPLERRVARAVRAPQSVVEDACQFAWGQLVGHRDRVKANAAVAWLLTTATREAIKLTRVADRELSLESEIERGGECLIGGGGPAPEELVERRERLASVRELPPRQQRIVWLKALGLSRGELARHERLSGRTVERQLAYARRRLRAAARPPAPSGLSRAAALATPSLGGAELARPAPLLGGRPAAAPRGPGGRVLTRRRAPAGVTPDEQRDPSEHDQRPNPDRRRGAAAQPARAR
jgi:RNA polymerase sigma factor (sigma-70 family)